MPFMRAKSWQDIKVGDHLWLGPDEPVTVTQIHHAAATYVIGHVALHLTSPQAFSEITAPPLTPSTPEEEFTFTIHRSDLIPGGNRARIGFSDDFPDRQFLLIPENDDA
jgi:hypothetical protein